MEDETLFAMYYTSIVSLEVNHPGSGRGDHSPKTLDQLRDQALQMVRKTREVYPKWQDGQQQ